MIAAYLFTALLIFLNLLHPLCFLVLLSLPIAIKNFNIINHATIETLEEIKHLDAKTSELVLVYGILFSISNFIAGFFII